MKERRTRAAEPRHGPAADRHEVPAAIRRAAERRLLARAKREEAALAAELEKAASEVADVFQETGRKLRDQFGPAASTALCRAIAESVVLFAAAVATDRWESPRPAGSTGDPEKGGGGR